MGLQIAHDQAVAARLLVQAQCAAQLAERLLCDEQAKAAADAGRAGQAQDSAEYTDAVGSSAFSFSATIKRAELDTACSSATPSTARRTWK